jgi:AIR synthase-related protein
MTLLELVQTLREGVGLLHKREIQGAGRVLDWSVRGPWGTELVRLGDDCAAIPDQDGYLLFAAEGIAPELVARSPRAAGYCSVLVNASDIYAMGGRPLAVVDAVWTRAADGTQAIIDGMQRAATQLGIPIVGGHTNAHSPYDALAVAIVGRARSLITSFDAAPGDDVLVAVDLRGKMQAPSPFWDATDAPAQRMRDDYAVLPWLAEQGLCRAGKDISMAGLLGSLLMLLESSAVGARIELARIPRPPGIAWAHWLSAFPSYGFVLSVAPEDAKRVIAAFEARGLACARVGQIDQSHELALCDGVDTITFWNLSRESLTRHPDKETHDHA